VVGGTGVEVVAVDLVVGPVVEEDVGARLVEVECGGGRRGRGVQLDPVYEE
jgi:hypothetical protein